MKEITLEYCNELMEKFNKYKETAGQHEFPLLLAFDMLLVPVHRDLNRNYNQEHAKAFVRGMKDSVFPKLNIPWED